MTWEILGEGLCGTKLLARCSCSFEKEICKRTYKRGLSRQCKSCASKKVAEDLTGMVFGSYLVISELQRGKYGQRRWLCECSCGGVEEIRQDNLVSGGKTMCHSCKMVAKNPIAKCSLTDHRLYVTWHGMKQRCYNPNSTDYKYWGGKGIKVCDRWLTSFENFLEDMEPSFVEGLTLDRIDGNKDYSFENCKWSTAREQSLNKSKPTNNIGGG